MTHRRRVGRRLQTELLEARLALSATPTVASAATSDAFHTLYPHAGAGTDPVVRAAIDAITTTASHSDIVFRVDPGPAPAQASGEITTSLAESTAVIGLNDFRNDVRFAGVDGSGYSIVIIDTGADLDHPFFGPDSDGDGVADRIVYSADFYGDRTDAQDGNGHGTHVASIAASQDATHTGIAPGVNLIVLRALNNAGVSTAASIESALQWVVANVSTYNIASVNMSLSTFENFAEHDTRPDLGFSDEIGALAAQDVIVAASAGNAYFDFLAAPGVSYPAADPNALAVSATWDADVGGPINWASGARDNTTGVDRVVSFSQRHPTMTTIFAPGAPITAAAIGGGLQVISGTSMASPMVAGAAVLAQQLAVQLTGERLSVSQFKDLLQSTAASIFDGDDEDDNVPNTNAWYGRLDVMALGEAILAAAQSDLQFDEEMSVESADVPTGGVARVAYAISNSGLPATGEFQASFYLSADGVIDASDTLLSTFTTNLAGLQAMAQSGVPVPLPVGVAPGDYYLGLVLDAGQSVVEGDEANNVSVVPLTIAEARAEAWLFDETAGASLQSGIATVDFGVIDQDADDSVRTFRIYNDGSELLILGPLSLPEGYGSSGFPSEVPAGESVQFTVWLESSSPIATYSGVASFDTNNANENPFTLQFDGKVVEPDDHGDNAEDATIVTMPATIDGTIFQSGEVDWFRIRAVAGVQHTFQTILGTLSDSVLKLYDSDGVTLLASDDNSGPGLASLIEWVAPRDGFFYLEVSRKLNASGDYQLSMIPADDHGNDMDDATPVSDPSLIAGTIETPSDQDWYSFPAREGVPYEIETVLRSLGGSTIRVMDSDGVSQLAISAPSDPRIGSIIHWIAPADGSYYIVVEGSSSTQLGAYDLKLTGDDDYGDNAANATAIGIPGEVAGVVEASSDVDWFSFSTIAGASYQFSAPGTTTDYVLRVVDSDGVTELARADGTGAAAAQLQWIAPTSGVYFVEVSAVGAGTGAYQLTAALVDDHGDAAAAATPMTDPSVLVGAIAPAGDVDWFSFSAIAGVEYQLQATPLVLEAVSLRLVGTDGVISVLGSATGSNGQAATITWTAPSDGVYFLRVASATADGVGTYELAITADDDHGDAPANATQLAIPHPTDGKIERAGDADWFQLDAIAGLDYRVEIGLGTLPEARIRLYGPDGTTLVAEAVSDGEPLAALQWNAGYTHYFIEVTTAAAISVAAAGPGPATGDYQIKAVLLSALPGDFNGDDKVDGADLLLWQRLLGQTSIGAPSPLDADGFEAYTPGLLQDAGQGWVKLGPPQGSATVDDSDPANQVIRVERGVNADNRWGVPLGPVAPLNNVMLIMWDMMVLHNDERAGALGPFFGVEAYDDEGTFGLLGSFGVDATSLDLLYQAQDTGFFTETGVKAAAGVWHNFAISLDYARHEYTVYFDGQPLATTGFVDRGPLHTALDQLTDADISALASQNNNPSRHATGTAYYDNFRIVNGVSGEYLRADGNRNGVVDGLDLQLWKDHYGLDYSGGSSSAVAAAAASTSPLAPTSFLAASMSPRFEASRLDASLPESMSNLVEVAPEQILTPATTAADWTWLAYAGRSADETAPQRRSLLGAEVQDARPFFSPLQRDAALTQLSSAAEDGVDGRWSAGDERDVDAEADLAFASLNALDALFAEL